MTNIVTALVVPLNGPPYLTEIDASFESLHQIVGGWIEHVDVTQDVHAYCNEEGKIAGLPLNLTASLLANRLHFDPLVGTVVFLGHTDDGEEASLPSDWLAPGLPRPTL